MKIFRISLVLILALCLVAVAGCKEQKSGTAKPSTPPAPTAPAAPAAPTDLSAAAKSATESATTAAKAVAEKFTFDPAKSLDTVKAEAAKMDATQLRDMALKALGAIKDKESLISTLTAQQKALSIDKVATEGQKIMDQLKQAQDALTSLKSMFKTYYDALVAKGGDTSGLQLP